MCSVLHTHQGLSISYICLKSNYSSPLWPLVSKPLLFCTWITAVNSYLIFTPALKPLQPRHHSAGIITFLKQIKPNHPLLKPTRLFNTLMSHPSGHRWANISRCFPHSLFSPHHSITNLIGWWLFYLFYLFFIVSGNNKLHENKDIPQRNTQHSAWHMASVFAGRMKGGRNESIQPGR